MSHIDSFKHELVGFLGYLPVYHPLEVIDGDFKSNSQQLMLGGGSGEHPALVVEHPTALVAHFLNKEIETIKSITHWKDFILPYLNTALEDLLTFYNWDKERYDSFYLMSKSPILPNPNRGNDLEWWLILGLGEFIFFSMPTLALDLIENFENPYKHFQHSTYNNIMVVPPNLPVYANGGNMFFRNQSIDKTFL